MKEDRIWAGVHGCLSLVMLACTWIEAIWGDSTLMVILGAIAACLYAGAFWVGLSRSHRRYHYDVRGPVITEGSRDADRRYGRAK